MININLIVTDQIIQSGDWTMSQKVIDQIQSEILFYKNLSFKVVNVDQVATTRNDPSTSGITKFPWLRAFENGNIIDNWAISKLELKHWETWKNKHGIKYTLAELDEIRKSSELRAIEEERKRIEALLNEQKAKSNSTFSSISKPVLIIGGLFIAYLMIKK